MKKIRYLALVIVACLFLTGCGCTKNTVYNVSFDSDGGSKITTQEVKDGETLEKPEDPVRDGYEFKGWFIDDTEYDFSKPVTADITLKAKWEKTQDNVCNLTCKTNYRLDTENCRCVYAAGGSKSSSGTSTLSLSTAAITLNVGESIKVKVISLPNGKNTEDVTWVSAVKSIATVVDGLITGVTAGETTVYATVGDEIVTVKVIVSPKIADALAEIEALELTLGNTDLNYTYAGCSIDLVSATPNNDLTVISGGVVTKLYRALEDTQITATYKVTCGNNSKVVSVNHTVLASDVTATYAYPTSYTIVVKPSLAGDYTLTNTGIANLKYNALVGGYQTSQAAFKLAGTTYLSDGTTMYEVALNKEAE